MFPFFSITAKSPTNGSASAATEPALSLSVEDAPTGTHLSVFRNSASSQTTCLRLFRRIRK